MREAGIWLLFLFILGSQGCIIIPMPENKALHGKRIVEDDLSFIQEGVTTKADVIRELGNPNVFWEDERIFAYIWKMRQYIMPWAFGAEGGAVGGVEDLGRMKDSLLIQFDQNDRVLRFEKTVRPLSDSWSDHLINWAAQGKREEPVPVAQ